MAGFIMVEPKGIDSEADLAAWVAMARRYVESLPIKNKKPIYFGTKATMRRLRGLR